MNIPYGPILVVEDAASVLDMLEVTLRLKGYPVATARNGQDALEYISQQHPALVITDILMPKMDGYTLAHTLRKDPQTSQIPIVFLSATYIAPEDKQFAFALGAVHFLEKPIDTEDFLLTIAEILTTENAGSQSEPMQETDFFEGYRDRLEQKRNYKNIQIMRTERLLQTLPGYQKPAFETLRLQAITDRNQIQEELDELDNITNFSERPPID